MNAHRQAEVIDCVKNWVDNFIIELDLCPFARRVRVSDRIRFVVTDTNSESVLLEVLAMELSRLTKNPKCETTLLIHPEVLGDFLDYNQFLNHVDDLLATQGHTGIFQVASFHPGYQFAGTEPDEAQNYSNRSPYPLLHILREQSIEQAVTYHPDVDSIPASNIEKLENLGIEKIKQLLQ